MNSLGKFIDKHFQLAFGIYVSVLAIVCLGCGFVVYQFDARAKSLDASYRRLSTECNKLGGIFIKDVADQVICVKTEKIEMNGRRNAETNH